LDDAKLDANEEACKPMLEATATLTLLLDAALEATTIALEARLDA